MITIATTILDLTVDVASAATAGDLERCARLLEERAGRLTELADAFAAAGETPDPAVAEILARIREMDGALEDLWRDGMTDAGEELARMTARRATSGPKKTHDAPASCVISRRV